MRPPLYYRFISLATPLITSLLALVNDKLARRRAGLARQPQRMPADLSGRRIVWFHCASLGEYEQARPVILQHPRAQGWATVVTFYSPSGYEVRHGDPLIDWALYLPDDTPDKARAFVSMLAPERVFWVKYEFWPNHLHELSRRGIPVYLLSAHIRAGYLRGPLGLLNRRALSTFRAVFVQSASSVPLLQRADIMTYFVTGDTRLDAVSRRVAEYPPHPGLDRFAGHAAGLPVVCLGSLWPSDWRVIGPAVIRMRHQFRWIIAPHQPDQGFIDQLLEDLPDLDFAMQSREEEASWGLVHGLILDKVGLLARAYGVAQAAYVGGAFQGGLHNIWEPAAWGLPVAFGPHSSRYPEGDQLLEARAAVRITRSVQMTSFLEDLITRTELLAAMGRRAHALVEAGRGATDRIMAVVRQDDADPNR